MSNAILTEYIGNTPPTNPGPNIRWRSQSHRHLSVSPGPMTRKPILGSGLPGVTAAAELSPWWNAETGRMEAIYNSGNSAMYSYAPSPLGPWALGVNTLGFGVGGEAGAVSQQMVLVEGDTLYMFYCRNQVDVSVRMATSPKPTAANPVPVWTYRGVVWTDTAGGGSIWVMRVNGVYWMFLERADASARLVKSTAATAADLVATPFTLVARNLYMPMPFGIRGNQRWGRPCVIYEEDGTWISYWHAIGTSQFGNQFAQRFICKPERDGDDPVTWTPDPEGSFVREENPLEVDQIADFRVFQAGNGVWYASWSANDNVTGLGTTMVAPMQEPVMAFDGGEWTKVGHLPDLLADFPYINADTATANQAIRHRWDVVFDTSAGTTLTATAPRPASRANFKLSCAPNTLPGGQVKLAMSNAVDRIMGPIAIASLTASGTTVTMVTKQPHGLTTDDFVTVTGCTPTAYNVTTGAAVASVVDANTITYVAASAPATNTAIGCFDRSLRPGEVREYEAKTKPGTFYRR